MRFLRLLALIIILMLVLAPATVEAEQRLELEAEAAILLDMDSGKVLFSLNPDKPLYPASTTKIMTALLLVESADLDQVIEVGEEINLIGNNSSTADLEVGDRLTVADMVYALMLASGNDASYTTAVYVARRVSGFEHMEMEQAIAVFARLMNSRARELGAENTHFVVPDGYHTPEHVSTARDLAIITQTVIEHEFIRQVVSSPKYHWQDIKWTNSNRLLRQDCPEQYYPWATGFKTGYTPEAGCCLVATAAGHGRQLLGVVLNSTGLEVWKDTRNLLEYGFNSWQNYAMLVEGQQVFTVPVQGQRWGQPNMMRVDATEGYSDLLPIWDIKNLDLHFDWAPGVLATKEPGVVLQAPLRKDQFLGEAVVCLEGEVLARVDMVAAYTIKGFPWGIVLAVAFLALLPLVIRRLRRAKEVEG